MGEAERPAQTGKTRILTVKMIILALLAVTLVLVSVAHNFPRVGPRQWDPCKGGCTPGGVGTRGFWLGLPGILWRIGVAQPWR